MSDEYLTESVASGAYEVVGYVDCFQCGRSLRRLKSGILPQHRVRPGDPGLCAASQLAIDDSGAPILEKSRADAPPMSPSEPTFRMIVIPTRNEQIWSTWERLTDMLASAGMAPDEILLELMAIARERGLE